jgi:7-carboxy-7-deazaguanine synthase
LSNVPEKIIKIIDVKTPSSGHSDSFLMTNLNHFNNTKDNLKFVLGSIDDYAFMKSFLREYNLFGANIIVSTVFNNQMSPQIIVEMILKDRLNVRFQQQLHKYIWNHDKRGV